jgi:hypothetical protein
MQDQPNNALTMSLSPIGVVRSPIKKPMLTAGESDLSLAERMDKIKAYHQGSTRPSANWSSRPSGRNC